MRRFAIVIGSNVGKGSGLPRLSYADDDALATYDLLAVDLGFETILLTEMDGDTQNRWDRWNLRRNRHVLVEPPTTGSFRSAIKKTITAAAEAKAIGDRVRILVWISSHAGIGGELFFADGKYERGELTKTLLEATNEAQIDLDIVLDTCFPWSVFGRGTNNEALVRARAKEALASQLERFPRVGVLLAETGIGETMEWSQLASGIFSFIVRSALRGAADADGDGRVTLKEVEAFGYIANLAIQDERARLQVRAVLPQGSENRELVDWAEAPRPPVKLRLPPESVRLRLWHPDTDLLLETHKGQDLRQCAPNLLFLPADLDRLHVTWLRGEEATSWLLPPSRTDRELLFKESDLTPDDQPRPHGDSRSMALREGLFLSAFDGRTFQMWKDIREERWEKVDAAVLERLERKQADQRKRTVRRWWGWGLVGGAVLGTATGVVSYEMAASAYQDWTAAARRGDASEMERLEAKTRHWDLGATVAFGTAGALLAAGAVVLLWDISQGIPAADSNAGLTLRIGSGISLAGRF